MEQQDGVYIFGYDGIRFLKRMAYSDRSLEISFF